MQRLHTITLANQSCSSASYSWDAMVVLRRPQAGRNQSNPIFHYHYLKNVARMKRLWGIRKKRNLMKHFNEDFMAQFFVLILTDLPSTGMRTNYRGALNFWALAVLASDIFGVISTAIVRVYHQTFSRYEGTRKHKAFPLQCGRHLIFIDPPIDCYLGSFHPPMEKYRVFYVNVFLAHINVESSSLRTTNPSNRKKS